MRRDRNGTNFQKGLSLVVGMPLALFLEECDMIRKYASSSLATYGGMKRASNRALFLGIRDRDDGHQALFQCNQKERTWNRPVLLCVTQEMSTERSC